MKAWLLAASTLAFATAGYAQDYEYRVLSNEADTGFVRVDREDGKVVVDVDIKNNGRGPTRHEVYTLGPDGMPIAVAISGTTTFGNPIDEWYRIEDGRAVWMDAAGGGSADAPALYISQNGADPLLTELLFRAPDMALPVLPGGTARLRTLETRTYEGADGPVVGTTYELSGLSMTPQYVTLDEQGILFAQASASGSVVRKGYEAADAILRERAAAFSTARLSDLQAEHAHRYEGPVRLTNVHVFDSVAGKRTGPHDVVLSGDRIALVEAAGSTATPGETVIDGRGGTLVPGMYEMHGHLGQESAITNLLAGITSVRDVGNRNDVLADLVTRIEQGTIAGPRITRSGFIEGKSDFNSQNGIVVDSLDKALDAVRWYAARGYWGVKLYNSMRPDWNGPVAAEAHRLGLKVHGHVPAFATADQMIAAGYDEITHANQAMLGWVIGKDEDTRTLFRFTAMRRFPDLDPDGEQVTATLSAMAERGIAHDPTMAIHELGLTAVDGVVSNLAKNTYDNMPASVQRGSREALFGTETPQEREEYIAAYGFIVEVLKRMHRRGILLVPGTDLGGGFAYHRELELFETLGMTPAEVLSRATIDMARYLGQEEDLGSIERGKYADLFLVDGDPTSDLGDLKKINLVAKGGAVYFPADIYPAFGIAPFAASPTVTPAQ